MSSSGVLDHRGDLRQASLKLAPPLRRALDQRERPVRDVDRLALDLPSVNAPCHLAHDVRTDPLILPGPQEPR